MAGCDERRITSAALKGIMESFMWKSKRLAAPLLKPFGPSSEPACIDEEDLEKLEQLLGRIRTTLVDAETREIRDESVKLWLKELRGLELSGEDIIEEFEFASLRARRLEELEMELLQSGTRKRKHEVRTTLSSQPITSLARKLQKFRDRYDEIASDRKSLRLREGDGKRRPEGPVRDVSSSFVKGHLYGREVDMEKMIHLVLSDADADAEADACVHSVIPIVGMGGVGKTTLVQHVYNNEKVASHFDLRIWVFTPQEFDVIQITRAIIEGVTEQPCYLTELNVLQNIAVEKLKGKRLLLVLDDVWCDKHSYCDSLQALLNVLARGSKVLVTTRNERVAKIMGTMPIRHLSCLSDHHCWFIIQQHAFDGRDPSAHPNLPKIGKGIVEKCKGLPLAAKALGGLLRTAINEQNLALGGLLRTTINEQNLADVLQSDLWDMDQLQSRVLSVLRLSYDHLPMYLKRCFEYCSLFPKGYIFERKQLVQLWMAQGFLEPDRRSQPEDIGNKYFDELIERTFFQPSLFGDHRYMMHDLFHELAQSISGDECCMVEDYMLCEVHKRARYLSLVPHESHLEKIIQFESFDGQDQRTFLFIRGMERNVDEIPFLVKIPNELFLHLECLRALDLSNTNIKELPNSICNLKHLRYFGLRNTKIKSLPESTCGLFNLQTLDLKCSYDLKELPIGTRCLFRLRHLEVPFTNIFLPSGIGELIDLQTLPVFIVGSSMGHCRLGELKDLVKLRGDLHISGLSHVVNEGDADEANMKNKKSLKKLTLEWCSPDRTLHLDDKVVAEVLDRLRPHPELEVLVIRDYCGITFAKWIGDPDFSKLASVSLKDCSICQELPPLGQLPVLTHLTVQSMAGVRSVGCEFCGSRTVGFPNLKTLRFTKMHEWEIWTGVKDGDFPMLESLTISGCCNLRGLPRINSLKKLGIRYCEQLHVFPPLSSLQSLKMEGYRNVPELPCLSALETVEIGCCYDLKSVGNLQHLASLRKLTVRECPKLLTLRNQLPLMPQGDDINLPIIQPGDILVLEKESQNWQVKINHLGTIS